MTSDSAGGVWTYTAELARALGEYGIEVSLAVMGGPLSERQKKDIKGLENIALFEGPYKLEWMDEPWDDVKKAGKWLLKLEDEIKPDIVHLNGYAHGALPWKAPSLVVGHSCVLSWWSAVKKTDAPCAWDRYRDAVSRGLKAADMVAAPTKAMLAELYKFYGVRQGRVIPNGRRPELFSPGEKEGFVFTVGRLWDEAKNASALRSIASGIKWPVYFAGERIGPSGALAVKDVRFLGPLSSEELTRYYSKASIYALPAFYEPFGLSILEAGLSGCALVLGDIPSLRENWDGAALFVRPDDTSGLKQAVSSIISSPSLAGIMGSVARQRAFEFGPARMALGYLAAYGELMELRSDRSKHRRNADEGRDLLPFDSF